MIEVKMIANAILDIKVKQGKTERVDLVKGSIEKVSKETFSQIKNQCILNDPKAEKKRQLQKESDLELKRDQIDKKNKKYQNKMMSSDIL